MTDEQLREIAERASAAPEGGFTVDESGFLRPVRQGCTLEDHHDCAVGQMVWLNPAHGPGFNRELAALFASAGSDVSALIAEVRRLRGALEEAERAAQTLRGSQQLSLVSDPYTRGCIETADAFAASVRALVGEVGGEGDG